VSTDDGDPHEAVFKALADGRRRLLLDRLQASNGLTTGELCALLPDLTRFGVMAHLRVLEQAGLVLAQKSGREKYHYLNPAPIRLIQERWITKFAEPWVDALAHLKSELELEGEKPMAKPAQTFTTYVKARPERVWDALTRSEDTTRYYYGSTVASTWQPGDPIVYRMGDVVAMEGVIIEADRPHRLVHTLDMRYSPEVAADRPSRYSWVLEPIDGATKVTVRHEDFDPLGATAGDVAGGSELILAGLKTLLETGTPLAVGG
jgi:DNA-binding transcriptional ArsR family regulator/uncharacterized protein YndB with AHSA1/START domain